MKHPPDKLLTLLGQNAGLSALTGQDRADTLAYGRSVWEEASLRRTLRINGPLQAGPFEPLVRPW